MESPQHSDSDFKEDTMKKPNLKSQLPLKICGLFILAARGSMADPCCSILPANRPCIKTHLSDQTNVYTEISFLYWGCAEKGLDFALKNNGPQFNSDITVHSPSFKWNPAFRLMLGYHLPFDNWKIDGTYSLFRQHLRQNLDSADANRTIWSSDGSAYRPNGNCTRAFSI
jgi:hypothetical protein